MSKHWFKLVATSACAALLAAPYAHARDGKVLYIPLRSHLSPVQRLNREGVEAVQKHNYEKAEQFFYKAYLYDPADPFTLNNLGYVSELQGNLDRAHKFYDLAAQQGSDANIDKSNLKSLKDKPMKSALVDLKDNTMRVNRWNIDAMRLLAQGRGFEAIDVLKKTSDLEPNNPFTLNNLGVASEAVGDLNGALKYYTEAASSRSSERAVVTEDRSWRGKEVTRMAAENVKRVRKLVQKSDPTEARAVMLTLHGVYETNRNNWDEAKKDFVEAYRLDPNSAFSLNNRGYVAEHEGDLETAQFFYEKAQRADNANAKVGAASQLTAQGQPLAIVATGSNQKVDQAIDVYSRERRNQQGPVELTPRNTNAAPVNPPQPQ